MTTVAVFSGPPEMSVIKMGLLGCPLCCQQDFVSVVALHDHLLYYIYRPLKCGVCFAHVGGIHELTHHLQRHMGDGMPTPLHAHSLRTVALAGSEQRIVTETHDGGKGKVANNDDASSHFCSLLSNTSPNCHAVTEEPIELILRAYFCQTCGEKVVGKDAYFSHIKQHSVVQSNRKSEILSRPLESGHQLSSPAGLSEADALRSNLASDASTPGILTTDTETLLLNDSEEPSEHLSDYIEETDTANQLLKLREWQLEKLGKSFRRHKISFGRSPAVSEMSPTSGKLTSNSSPSTIINPPHAGTHSNNTYLYSHAKSDSYIPESSVDGHSCTAERPSSCNPSPADGGLVNADPCSLRTPDIFNPSAIGGSHNVDSCSAERFSFVNMLPSTYCGPVDVNRGAGEQSEPSLPLMNSNAEPVCDSIQVLSSDYSKFNSDGLINDKITNEQVTAPSSGLQFPVELVENLPHTSDKLSRIEREMSLYHCLDQSSANEDLYCSLDLPGTDHISESPNHNLSQDESTESAALASTSLISSHQSVPDLELQTLSNSKSSLTLLYKSHCTSDYIAENSQDQDSASGGKIANELPMFHKSLGSSCQTVEPGKSCCIYAKSNCIDEQGSMKDSANLLDYDSHNKKMLSTNFESNEMEVSSKEIKSKESFGEERTLKEGSNVKETSQYIKHTTDVTVDENPSNSENFAESVQYLHKKFHHDQERKVLSTPGVGQGADVNRYIHSYQSLLVSKFNGTLGTEMPFKSNKICPDANTVKQRGISPISQSLEMQQQPLSKENVCEVCNLQCANRSLYQSHYRTHEVEGQKNFLCQFCGQKYFKKYSKDLHERKHTGQKVHHCSQCSKVFTKVFSYLRHQREVHDVQKAFICTKCSKGFSTQRRLKEHIGVHQRNKAHKCNQCNHSCHTASGLRTHVLEIHSGAQNYLHSCEICGEKFAKQYGLKRHKERKHLRQKLSCEICSKVFTCREDHLHHMKTHLNNEPIKCDACEKIFSTSWALQRHSKSHQATPIHFQCNKCTLTFTRNDSLVSHLKIHDQKRAFVCHCGKQFVKKSQLKEHEDKHSNYPKYSCDVCKHSFKFKVSLRNHSCKNNATSVISVSNEELKM